MGCQFFVGLIQRDPVIAEVITSLMGAAHLQARAAPG